VANGVNVLAKASDNKISLWDLETYEKTMEIDLKTKKVQAIYFLP